MQQEKSKHKEAKNLPNACIIHKKGIPLHPISLL